MSSRPRCFISYSHGDVDSAAIHVLINLLRNAARQKIEFLFDDFVPVGGSLTNFMNTIDSVDGIMILMTPSYKEKIERRQGGVHYEYARIVHRMATENDGTKKLLAFPILFSGDDGSSVPMELSTLKYADFRKFRAIRDHSGEYKTSKQVETDHFPFIKGMVDQIFAIHSLKSPNFKEQYDRWFRTLFLRKKEEWQSSNVEYENDIQPKIFVKTHAFRHVAAQTAPIIVGRKGSGKSTVAKYLPTFVGSYKIPTLINVDHFRLENIFSLFAQTQIGSDTRNLMSIYDMFRYSWELFIHICCMEVISIENNNGNLSIEQARSARPVILFLEHLQNQPLRYCGEKPFLDSVAVFDFCLATFREFVEDAIRKARNEPRFFLFDIKNLTRVENFIRYAVGEAALEGLHDVAIRCRRKFLFSLDGFDSAFDDFRRNTLALYNSEEYYSQRLSLEISWLRSLVDTVIRMKSNHERSSLYGSIDFCVTVPKDRFAEVLRVSRDSYNYFGRFININWSGVELAIMLYKRVEVYKGHKTNKELRPHERYNQIMAVMFPQMPNEITITIEKKEWKMPLFLYVLRHTFWRPRDVLFYFAAILAAADDFEARKVEISEESIKRIVSETTRIVIDSEFINEYKSSVRNFKEILLSFSRSKQVMNYNDMYNKVGQMDFEFLDQPKPCGDIDEKITFLYELGFIGIRKEETTHHPGSTFAFYFNEGDEAINIGGKGRFRDATFAIHPIFCEYLQLEPHAQELVLNYSWDYIIENEIHRFPRL